jgi:SAM-dependent methyltransferase
MDFHCPQSQLHREFPRKNYFAVGVLVLRKHPMNTPPSVFGDSIQRWIAENDLPWMKLKTEIGLSNLRKHLPKKPLSILDAGGGSGCDSIPLAREGHRVDLVDYSEEMLNAARENTEREGLQENIRFHATDVTQLDRVFPQPQLMSSCATTSSNTSAMVPGCSPRLPKHWRRAGSYR